MFPPFPQNDALEVCRNVARALDGGILRLDTMTEESRERSCRGVMLGAMICSEPSPVTLITLSGLHYVIAPSPECEADSYPVDLGGETLVFVMPVVSAARISSALEKNDSLIHSYTRLLKEGGISHSERSAIKKSRAALCGESLDAVHSLYSFCCMDGKTRTLRSIAQERGFSSFPTGTGDCCAPKLINYAAAHNLRIKSMAELYYDGAAVGAERCSSLEAVAPCDSRCSLILPSMLGLEILYRDDDIVVINKPSGLLSIPGRGEDKKDSVTTRLKALFPECIEQPSVHRLDMETSGLMVLALTKESHRALSIQFAEGVVSKEYIALLDGSFRERGIEEAGTKELCFRLDVDNRPHQIWDEVYGKKAVTSWRFLGIERRNGPDGRKYASRVLFIPHTGRTHQLRLLASDSRGFSLPILGDTLYGEASSASRLMLHASRLSFVHPVTGERMEFTSPSPF